MTFSSLQHGSCFSQVILICDHTTSDLMEELMLLNFSRLGASLSFSVHSQNMIFLFMHFQNVNILFLPATQNRYIFLLFVTSINQNKMAETTKVLLYMAFLLKPSTCRVSVP